MSIDRSGEGPSGGEAVPRSGARTPAWESVGERIGEALRRQSLDQAAEEAAVGAFRDARAAGEPHARARRADDWRPKARRQRWLRGGGAAVVTTALLGGIALASVRMADDPQRQGTPDPGTSHSTGGPSTHPPGDQASPPAGPGTTPGARAQHPETAKDLEAHCRAYERIKNRGHALDSTAWQRLVRAAGGEEQVPAYCAALTGSADTATPSPTKTNKNGKANGRPSTAGKPSKGNAAGHA